MSGGGHGPGDEEEGPPQFHEEHRSHEEPWLVSYADLMTLLFGFFVLMYSFAAAKNEEKRDVVAIRKELSQFFGKGYVNPLDGVAQKLQEELAKSTIGQKIGKNMTILVSPEGLEVTFSSTVLFQLGQPTLEPEARNLIQNFVDIIKESKGSYAIRVEGYTDDIPIATEKFPSNWELSAARAATVVRIFEASKFDPNLLTAVGFGATRAKLPNRDEKGVPIEDNRAKNRRVVIYITQNLEAENKAPPPPAEEGHGGEHGEAESPAHGEAAPTPAPPEPAHGEAAPTPAPPEAPAEAPSGHGG